MKKIPSVFKRHHDGDRLIYDEVVEGCEWVLNGEGIATIKYDGTACMIKDGMFYKRYDRKGDKPEPDGWIAAQDPDPVTGHWPGWVLVGAGPEDKHHRAAWEYYSSETVDWTGLDLHQLINAPQRHAPPDGTYELIGTKIQGNPYNLSKYCLMLHGGAVIDPDPPRTFEELRGWLEAHPCEGIVFHHSDGERMAKVKRRDYGLAWPLRYEEFDETLIIT